MEVRFVTSNPGKFREVRRILSPYGVHVRLSRRSLPELQADSLAEVVEGKLRAAEGSSLPVLVEDSGLFIASLAGFPGVYSAYIYRIWGFDPILKLLKGRPRAAVFRTVAGLRWDDERRIFTGECRGRIAQKPSGRAGFGFDPVFVPLGERHTFAELTPEKKNRLSHRGAAIRKVGKFLAGRAGHLKEPAGVEKH